MRCQTCDYELWNLIPTACPECGTGWSFEQFRFRAGAAQFLCPHCEHAYGGNDAAGLPTPRHFTCVGCQQEIMLSQMRALPAPGSNRDDAMEDRHPWMQRARIGRWRAFRQTTKQSLLYPAKLGSSLPANLTITAPLLYSVICNTTALAGCVLVPVTVMTIIELATSGSTAVPMTSYVPLLGGALGLALLQLLILTWCGCAHLLLRMTGETRHGWRHTTSALLFCSAPMLFAAIPCCGVYVAALSTAWMLVVAICALAGAQKVSAYRAALAVLVPSLGLLAIVGAFFILALTTGVTLSGGTPASTLPSAQGAAAADVSLVPSDAPNSDSQLLPAP